MAKNKPTLEQAVASGAAKPMSTGFGESKIFAAPEGTFVRDDVNPDIPPPEEWTINGAPIPAAFVHAIPFTNTDQGRKMIEDGKLLVDNRPRAEVVTTAEEKADLARARGIDPGTTATRRPQIENFDKAIQQRLDAGEAYDDTTMPRDCADPLADLTQRHVPPGFVGRFISDRVVQTRGLRGWKPLVGKDGRPVKLASQTLAIMPAETAKRRNEKYRGDAADKQAASVANFQEGQDRLAREAANKGMDFRPLGPNETVVGERGRADIGTLSSRNSVEPEILMET